LALSDDVAVSVASVTGWRVGTLVLEAVLVSTWCPFEVLRLSV
jgi:hypothetical protein